MRTVVASAVVFGLAVGVALPSKACTQQVAERLAARTEAERLRDTLAEHPVSGIYRLTAISDQVYSFRLETPVAGVAPETFETESFIALGCGIGVVAWPFEERAVDDSVLVLGSIDERGRFRPMLMYDPDDQAAIQLLRATLPGQESQ